MKAVVNCIGNFMQLNPHTHMKNPEKEHLGAGVGVGWFGLFSKIWFAKGISWAHPVIDKLILFR